MVTQNSVNERTAASGKVLQGQGVGTASDFSTATYPSTATGTGTILRADGTNWVATTSAYPNTNNSGDIIYGSASNVYSNLSLTAIPGSYPIYDGTSIVAFNPRKHYILYDDFPSPNFAEAYQWDNSASGTGSGCTNGGGGLTTNLGIVNLNTGTTSAGGCGFRLNATSTSNNYIVLGGAYIYLEWLVKLSALSNVTDTYTVWIGTGDTNGITKPNNGFFFQYTDSVNSGNWQIVTAAGGVYTTGNTSTAADTNFHKLTIISNAAGTSIAFYIDDVQVSSSPLSTNIPSLSHGPSCRMLKSAGTNNRSVALDYCYMFVNYTAAR